MDEKFAFSSYVREIAGRASRKLSSIRLISSVLDHKGCCSWCKSHVWPLMENCPVTWSTCSNTNLSPVNVIQCRAKRLTDNETSFWSMCFELKPLHTLQGEVSAMCMFYNVDRLNHDHINSLRMDEAHSIAHNIRGFQRRKDQLHLPFARTEQFCEHPA